MLVVFPLELGVSEKWCIFARRVDQDEMHSWTCINYLRWDTLRTWSSGFVRLLFVARIGFGRSDSNLIFLTLII
jgi:hypothetical protein